MALAQSPGWGAFGIHFEVILVGNADSTGRSADAFRLES